VRLPGRVLFACRGLAWPRRGYLVRLKTDTILAPLGWHKKIVQLMVTDLSSIHSLPAKMPAERKAVHGCHCGVLPTPDPLVTKSGVAARTFEQAILPHLDAAYNLARWLVRDPSEAEDIVQESVLRALKYFASFRGEDERAWLLQIVRNTSYSSLKKQSRSAEVSLGACTGEADDEGIGMDVPDPGPGPEAALAQRQDLVRLEMALAALPVEMRECIVLCELERLSYKEIARVTQVPIGTVMSRLWRARQALMRSSAAGESHDG
jgi:RNA polymerase sigma-70 factor (ECF subfamily)